ncbi:oligosaccharide flippase family protein [Sphingomonas agri]|uniref:oligosaccharide flippase family protein n=1 Tax=Sphingomonas agri TaxID=1813878 RepID=UPI00311E3824
MSFPIAPTPTKQRPPLRRLLALAVTRTGVLALTTVGNLVVRTGSSMILTRLLRPYDFGIVGIITSVFYMVSMVTDLGFQAFLVRHERTEDPHFRNVIWTIHAKRGFALFATVAAAAPLIAWALGKPVVALPLAVASATFVINGLASLSLMTALRRDKARELSILDFGLQIFQTIVGVLLALWWRNAWAIIAVMLLQSIVRCGLSYALFRDSSQRPERDHAIAREFFAFSRVILMSSALSLLIGQSDKLVLARLFTLDQFGLYAIAITIASAPVSFAESYVHRVLFPIYAQTWRQAPAEIGHVYYKAKRRAGALYAFSCGGLIGSASLLIALLYDPRYLPASTFLSLLMIASSLRLTTIAASEVLTAIGDMKRMLRMNVVRVLWLALAIPGGFVLLGSLGVVAAVGLIEVPAMLYSWVLLRRMAVLRIGEELTILGLICAGAAIGFLCSTEILLLFPHL